MTAADTHELGVYLRDVAKLNREQRNFRIFGPDGTLSKQKVFLARHGETEWNVTGRHISVTDLPLTARKDRA